MPVAGLGLPTPVLFVAAALSLGAAFGETVEPEPELGGIFISYRREESEDFAGRLGDTLSQHFGPDQVFRDTERIQPGERFAYVIEREVSRCDALRCSP